MRRIPEKYGFVELRRQGSYVVMQRKDGIGTTTVPVLPHPELQDGNSSFHHSPEGHPSYSIRRLNGTG
ncbi:MAG TPA: type II toxin-antitoxin system HicA family toxin [Candidatus Methylomirabilis sp.]